MLICVRSQPKVHHHHHHHHIYFAVTRKATDALCTFNHKTAKQQKENCKNQKHKCKKVIKYKNTTYATKQLQPHKIT